MTTSEPSPLVIGTVRTRPAAATRRAWCMPPLGPSPSQGPTAQEATRPLAPTRRVPRSTCAPERSTRGSSLHPVHRNRCTHKVAWPRHPPSSTALWSAVVPAAEKTADPASIPPPPPAEHAPASPKPTASGPGLPLLMLSHPQGLHDHHHGTRGGRVVMQTAGDKGAHLQGQPGAVSGMTFRGSVWGLVRAQQPSASTRAASRIIGCSSMLTSCRGATESRLLDRLGNVRAHEPPVPAELDARKHAAPGVVADRRARDVQQLGDLVGREQLVDPAHRGPPCRPGSVLMGCVSSPEEAIGFSR
jgi:hypothetical protein